MFLLSASGVDFGCDSRVERIASISSSWLFTSFCHMTNIAITHATGKPRDWTIWIISFKAHHLFKIGDMLFHALHLRADGLPGLCLSDNISPCKFYNKLAKHASKLQANYRQIASLHYRRLQYRKKSAFAKCVSYVILEVIAAIRIDL